MEVYKTNQEYYLFHVHDVWWGYVWVNDIDLHILKSLTPTQLIKMYECKLDEERNFLIFSGNQLHHYLPDSLVKSFFHDTAKNVINIEDNDSSNCMTFKMGKFWTGIFTKENTKKSDVEYLTIDQVFEDFDYEIKDGYLLFYPKGSVPPPLTDYICWSSQRKTFPIFD